MYNCVVKNIEYGIYTINVFEYNSSLYACHVFLPEFGMYILQRELYTTEEEAVNNIKDSIKKIFDLVLNREEVMCENS